MGQQFCTVCGAKLSEGIRFCESCGTPVETAAPVPAETPTILNTVPDTSSSAIPVPQAPGTGKFPLKIAAGIIIVLVIAAVAVLVVLPKLQDGSLPGLSSQPTLVPTTGPTPGSTQVTVVTTMAPTPTPDPFPDAFHLGERMSFGSGDVESEGTVYKYWINDTYQWHNDMDNKYYTQKPGVGNKYLFVFVHMVNNGSTRVWLPHAGNILVHYNGAVYSQDLTHYKPDKTGDLKATPIEVGEIQYYRKLNGDEYVEDFGFSHGTELGYIYPGKSNAVDGYIIYEVPQSLTPEKTYVAVSFNGADQGVWNLT